jgi:putative endonuclease
MPTERRQRGDAIEVAAREHLSQAGLKLVASNASYRHGELDLVMQDPSDRDGGSLVFVEVRYRRSTAFGGGATSVDAGKRRRILRAAQSFLASHPEFARSPCRFDVVEASGDVAAAELHWIKDAFRADDG